MTIPCKLGIRDLLPEFLADTLIVFAPLQSAGTIASGPLQSVPNHLNHFLVFIESDSHRNTSLPLYYRKLL